MKIFGVNIKLEWFIIVGLVVFLLVQRGCYNRANDKLDNNLDSITLANQILETIVNKQGQTIYTQEAIITNNQKAIKDLSDSKFDLTNKYEKKIKDVTFFYEAKLKAIVKEVYIPYPVEDTSKLAALRDSNLLYRYAMDSMISVPKKVDLATSAIEYTKGLRFSGTINKKDFKIDSVAFIDTQDIRIVRQKRNFLQWITFKPNKYEVQVIHSSPYMQVLGQNSVIYTEKKKAQWLLKAIAAGGLIYLGTRL